MDAIGKQKVEEIIEEVMDKLEYECDEKGIQIFQEEIDWIADEIRYKLTGEYL